MTQQDVEATIYAFGEELLFAVAGLETQPAGSTAVFKVSLRGRQSNVVVGPSTPKETPDAR